MRVSIGRKVNLLSVSVILILGLFLGFYFIQHETRALNSELDERATVLLNNLSTNSEYLILIRDREAISRLAKGVLTQKDVAFCRIEDIDGTVLFEGGSKREKSIREFTSTIVTKRVTEEMSEELVLGPPPEIEEEIGKIHLAISLSGLNQEVKDIRKTVAIFVIASMVLASIASSVLLKFILSRPITMLVRGTERIARGDLKYEVPVKRNDEIGILATSFNKMTEDLSRTLVSKNYVDNIIKSMTDTLIVINPDGMIETVNQATLDLLGYSEDELIGEPLGILFVGSDPFKVDLTKEVVISNVERTYLSKDGREIPVLFNSSVMKDEDGNVIYIVCTGIDIADRKRAEEALAQERNLLRTLIDNVPDHIYVKDTESRFVLANTALMHLAGATTPEELIGKMDSDFFSQEVSAQYHAYEQEIMRSGQPVINKEESDIDTAGNRTWALTTKVPLRDSSGKITGLMGINRDITELKRTEEALQHRLAVEERITAELGEKTEELSRNNEELNALLYTMAHDLKAHAVSLQGFSSLLMREYEDGLDEDGKVYIHRIQKNSEHMGILISDIIELSEIGRIEGREKLVSISDVISDVADKLAPELEERGTRLMVKDGMPTVKCDRSRMSQIFFNLISNASKFMGEDNEEPMIEVGYDGQDGYHRFYVKDNGIGIDKEYHEKVFHVLQCLNDIKTEGTGVGLAIVKKIVRSFGGEIWIDSAKGKGTTMYFTVPKAEGHRGTD